ncbi:hypothetical protein GGQ80_003116 [Sphingomonas jinjuensis]|uniref:Uncharacterized protein n=1 Tax=Sphingomonas jinjuensis TaxID=535907 RepID=A0A840FMP7_9SPHN|nr:hypothetical protein [Sphingomonas jinjuensis]MBB4155198.1 hypothetical protein [Sphingomonas jinjuensis]
MVPTLLVLALVAQEAPSVSPTPAPAATAVPIPAAPVIVLPAPTPTATPTPRSTPTPRAEPTPRVTPTPEPASTPSPSEGETSEAPPRAPAPTPSADARPTPQPVATPAPAVTAPLEPQAVEASGWAWWWLVIAAIAGAAVSAVVLRRRPGVVGSEEAFVEPAAVPPPPPPAPEPVPPVPIAAPPTARLGFVLRPTRAGLNLLSAVVEAELTVTNVGPEAAQDIRVAATLTSVHDGHEAVLAAVIAGEDGRPAVPPFALAPGETRTLRVVAAQPRDAIRPVSANGRPMLVPLVAINCRYLAAGERRQAAQSFAVGIERADSPKLAPFWLDQPPRTVSEVAARPHTERIER